MVFMGNGASWRLFVESSDGFVVQLPLGVGSYRVGDEAGADFALGSLRGTIEVSASGVHAWLSEQSLTLQPVAQVIDGFKLRAEGQTGSARRTQSLPGLKPGAAPPISLVDPKGLLPPRTLTQETRIGADESCDVRPRSDFISQFHCTLFQRGGQWFVKDLGSKNGTFLNEVRVSEGEIRPPAVLRLGDITWRIDSGEADEEPSFRHALIGQSQAIRDVIAKIEKFAPSRGSVLITGESGTGKELVARAIHDTSTRHKKPFVTINCGALAPALIESELFGHVRGSFTGAMDKRAGAFVSADGGTLFLDEIGELPLDLQPKLLRVLETQQVKAVGEDRVKTVNVRIVAATHRDLRAAVKRGTFREDLYHRLSVLVVEVPPLRQRRGDIDVLAQHFLNEMAGEELLRLSDDAWDRLRAHSFPGNVRELRNVLVRAVLLRHGSVITPDELQLQADEPVIEAPVTVSGSIDDAERATIVRALKAAKGSRMRAAKQLGIARSTLYRKLDEYRIGEHEYS